jgi:hypothetical protein
MLITRQDFIILKENVLISLEWIVGKQTGRFIFYRQNYLIPAHGIERPVLVNRLKLKALVLDLI